MLKKIFLVSLISLSLTCSGCAKYQSAQISQLVTPDEKRNAERAIARAIDDASRFPYTMGDASYLSVGQQSFGLKFTGSGYEKDNTPVLQGVVNAFAFIGTVGIIPFCTTKSVNYKSNIDNLSYGSSHYDCIGWIPMKQEAGAITSETIARENVDEILYDLFDLGYLSVDKVSR